MSKSTKTESAPKSKPNKGANFVHFVIALAVIVVLTSSAYTAFITAVGVGGKTNIYLASPSIVAIAGIISYSLFVAVRNFNK